MKKNLSRLLVMLFITSMVMAEDIKVGVIQGLSGPIAFYGKTTLNGIKLAIEEINKKGGVNGQKVKLIIKDNKGDAGESVLIAKQLISEGVVAILGPTISTSCLAVAPVAQEGKTPMLTATGTNTKITIGKDFVSRICFIDPFQGEVMANFASKNLTAKTAMILEDSASDYAMGLAKSFKSRFEKNGGKLLGKDNYVATDVDFSAQLTKIKAKNPDVIFVPGYTEVALIVKQARKYKIESVFLGGDGGDGWDSKNILTNAGASINGSFCSTHFSAGSKDPLIQNFLKAHKIRFGSEASVLTALGYDAGYVLAAALGNTGKFESEKLVEYRAKLKDSINKTKNIKGVTGTISLDENRNPIKDAFVLEAKDGKYVYKATVAPSKAEKTSKKTAEKTAGKTPMVIVMVILIVAVLLVVLRKKK